MFRKLLLSVLGYTYALAAWAAPEIATAAPAVPEPDEVMDPIVLSPDKVRSFSTRESKTTNSGISLKVLRETAPHSEHLLRDATYVGNIRLSPLLLGRPVQRSFNANEPIITAALPAELARLNVELEGSTYELEFVDEVTEAKGRVRHVSMAVINDPTAYGRFSIDVSAREIYGTLRTRNATYVFQPSGTSDGQTVYRYSAGREGSFISDLNRTSIARSGLARRHHQIELLATLQPSMARSDERSAFVRGGNLGSIEDVSPVSFKGVALRLAALTQLTGEEQFVRVAEHPTSDGGRIVRFKQLLDGIPVDTLNEVAVDRTGRVLELTASVVPVGISRQKPLLLAEDALSKTVAEWRAKFGKEPTIALTRPMQLQYTRENGSDNLTPVYTLEFEVLDDPGWYLGRVDAVSGATNVISLTQSATYVSCKDKLRRQWIGPGREDFYIFPPATYCPPNTVPPMERATLGYANPPLPGHCTQPSAPNQASNCYLQDTKNVYEVVSHLEAYFPGAIATNADGSTPACCTDINVTIIQNSRYSSNDLPNSTAGAHRIIMPTDESSSAEILAHELAHIYMQTYNSGTLNVDTNVFAGAVREGGADTIQGILGELSGRADRYGTKWVLGDGPGFADAPRSASNSSFRYWQDITLAHGPHDSGQVISRFFKRLQEISGISNQRLLGVVLGTLAKITDETQPQGIDAGDFISAVKKTIKPSETALRQAVDTLYAELYKADAVGPVGPPLPPGAPGPVGAPPITPNVWGTFAYCGVLNGGHVSVYEEHWTPTANTSRYLGWVKANYEPAFRFSLEVPASTTTMLLITNVSGEGRISSCNSFGCSGLSLSRLAVTQVCGF